MRQHQLQRMSIFLSNLHLVRHPYFVKHSNLVMHPIMIRKPHFGSPSHILYSFCLSGSLIQPFEIIQLIRVFLIALLRNLAPWFLMFFGLCQKAAKMLWVTLELGAWYLIWTILFCLSVSIFLIFGLISPHY